MNSLFKNTLISVLLHVRHLSRGYNASSYVFSHGFKAHKTVLIENYSCLNSVRQTDGSYLSKQRLIKGMNFQRQDDAAPFYNLSVSSLSQIYRVTQKDKLNGYCKNRLYFIAELIKCKPSTLSMLIVKRMFIYQLSFDWLEKSLNVLLEMGISGERILRDLWVLKYYHETIRQRLQLVKSSGCDEVYPWMVRCTEEVLERTIKLSQETKSILGSNLSTKEYLAHRLETSPDVIEDIYLKVPSLRNIRVVKAKNFLDFLFSEGYTKQDIINRPSVLAYSLSTIKQRLNKLQSLGITCINLNILRRSRKDFKKYLETVKSKKK